MAEDVQVQNEKFSKYGKIAKKEKDTFKIDFRLAPYKACILYKDENDLKKIAMDYRNLFYVKNKTSVLLMEIKDDDLQEKYDRLDELGVPYSIYLPSAITKDGLCLVRNRDTSLSETTHLSLVLKQFASIQNALSF